MESAKAQGKNMLCFFSAKDYEKNLEVLELKEDLYHSVRTGYEGFSLLYQPQIDSRTLELFGADANNMAAQLKAMQFPAMVVFEDGLYKVRVGEFKSLDNAVEMEQRLRTMGYNTFIRS